MIDYISQIHPVTIAVLHGHGDIAGIKHRASYVFDQGR